MLLRLQGRRSHGNACSIHDASNGGEEQRPGDVARGWISREVEDNLLFP